MAFRKYLDTCLLAIGLTAGLMTTTIGYRIWQGFDNQKKIEPYIRANKARIEDEVGQQFGISLDGVKLRFVDKLDDAVMQYDSKDDAVIVARNVHYPFLERPVWSIPIMNGRTIKGSYIHELGHDYFHQLMDQLHAEGKLHLSYVLDFYTTRVVVEGIADYFSVESQEDMPRQANMPENLEETYDVYWSQDRYEIGRRIVKPILDKLGAEEGIRRILIKGPPKPEEIQKPELYYRRIISGI